MNIQNLLNQFVGTGETGSPSSTSGRSVRDTIGNVTSQIPGGVAGGAAAGGIMALIVGNKSARKFAGKAATYGGLAVLGGLAYKGYQNWKHNQTVEKAQTATVSDIDAPHEAYMPDAEAAGPPLELTLIKAMIAAAKADGHIDADEQTRIFDAVERMNLPADQKGIVFDYLRSDISAREIASAVTSLEHKSEVYLASCLAIDPDHPRERAYLDELAAALHLPEGLQDHLEVQAARGLSGIE